MRGVGEIEFAGGAIEGAGDDRRQAKRAVRVFCLEREFVVEGCQKSRGVAYILKFVE